MINDMPARTMREAVDHASLKSFRIALERYATVPPEMISHIIVCKQFRMLEAVVDADKYPIGLQTSMYSSIPVHLRAKMAAKSLL